MSPRITAYSLRQQVIIMIVTGHIYKHHSLCSWIKHVLSLETCDPFEKCPVALFDIIRWSVPLAKTMPDRLEMLLSTHSLHDGESCHSTHTANLHQLWFDTAIRYYFLLNIIVRCGKFSFFLLKGEHCASKWETLRWMEDSKPDYLSLETMVPPKRKNQIVLLKWQQRWKDWAFLRI